MMRSRHVVPLMSALVVKNLVMQNGLLVRNALTQSEPNDLSHTIKRVETNRKKIESLSDACVLSDRTDMNNGGTEGWKDLLGEINEKQDEIIALARSQHDKSEAIMRLSPDGDIAALESDYLDAVDSFTMSLALTANKDIGQLTRLANREAGNVSLALITALCTGALLIFVVLRYISLPLQGMRAAVANFSKGDFESEIRVRGDGEIEKMASSLMGTAWNLGEIVDTARRASRGISGVAGELAVLTRPGDDSTQAPLEPGDGRGCMDESEMAMMADYLTHAANVLALLSKDIEDKLAALEAQEQPQATAEKPIVRDLDVSRRAL